MAKTQDTYTRHKPIIRKHKFQRTFVKDLADKIQMDLVDMGKYKTRTKDTIGFLQPLKSLVATRSQSQCIERIPKT